jgi:hypothetical protein
MKHRRHTPEQIIRKLREADRLLAEGHQVPEVAKQPEVSEATYHRARAQPRPPTGGARLQGHPRTRCLTNTHRPARPGSAALRRCCRLPAHRRFRVGVAGLSLCATTHTEHSRPGPPPAVVYERPPAHHDARTADVAERSPAAHLEELSTRPRTSRPCSATRHRSGTRVW